jgi:hypothetical protein
MPYVSDRQRRFFHSPGAEKAGITKKQVKEFDSASAGKILPDRVSDDKVEKFSRLKKFMKESK